ncbi:CotH kinase family protein [Anoxynatronum sibiricum]|uniref:CotH kinase family protein n=1 Tax=Anoxynatronum sibiricum TaxID=210623 RepID=A0ABU9VU88_9CLOT
MRSTGSTKNRMMLFILAAAAMILIAAAVFLLPESPPEDTIENHTLVPPVFSHTTGVYNSPMTLTLSAQAETTIHYTLDGSLPTTESPVYREPLVLEADDTPVLMQIPTTSDELYPEWGYDRYQWMPPEGRWVRHPVVRAMAVNEEGETSPVVGHTYLMGSDALPTASPVAGDPAMPAVLLITDPAGFFDDETGIYVPGDIFTQWRQENPEARVLGNSPANYLERGRDWERPAHVTLLEPDGTPAFTQQIGVRIHGGFTRAWAQKNLRLYARDSYDTASWFDYPIFPGHTRTGDGTAMTRYKRLLLRNSGNDWSHSLFRDALIHRLVNPLRVDSQAVRPTVVYLNGEYWGIHHLRERLDEYYLGEHYNIAPEDLVLVNERDWEAEVGTAVDIEEFQQHMSRITGFALSEEERFQLAATLIDMDHWYDHLATQLYAANTDWISNNMRVWRKRTTAYQPDAPYGHDGRWRWILFDLDYAFDFLGYGYETHDTVSWLAEESALFHKLSRSEAFRNGFSSRLADLLNTVFRTTHVQSEADFFTRQLGEEMPRNIHRWPQYGDMESWHREIQVIHDYAALRPDYLRQHTAAYFGLPGSVPVALDLPLTHQGEVTMSTLAAAELVSYQDSDGVFRGEWFAGVPLHLTATPAAGWQFSHWEISGGGLTPGSELTAGSLNDSAITLTPQNPSQPLTLRPVFRQ